jgi:predicted ABC-type ATPase
LGKEMLVKAISRKETYAFETTLGGNTITRLLLKASQNGIKVKMWYLGLKSVELNLARVRARVERGGHDIPETDIRKRWNSSRRNLIKLMPYLQSLRLYDNSEEANPTQAQQPRVQLLLQVEGCKVLGPSDLSNAPEWAKPLVFAAMQEDGI